MNNFNMGRVYNITIKQQKSLENRNKYNQYFPILKDVSTRKSASNETKEHHNYPFYISKLGNGLEMAFIKLLESL